MQGQSIDSNQLILCKLEQDENGKVEGAVEWVIPG